MSENLSSQDLGRLADDLRRIPAFAGLPDDHMTWLLEHFEEVRLAPGEIFLRPGDPAVWLTVVLEGEIRLQRENAADGPVYSISAGQVTGYLPYSRLTHFRATGRAVTPTRLVRMHRDNFPEMLHKMPELGHRLVAVMADRIR